VPKAKLGLSTNRPGGLLKAFWTPTKQSTEGFSILYMNKFRNVKGGRAWLTRLFTYSRIIH
jgi:hypothetical protein